MLHCFPPIISTNEDRESRFHSIGGDCLRRNRQETSHRAIDECRITDGEGGEHTHVDTQSLPCVFAKLMGQDFLPL